MPTAVESISLSRLCSKPWRCRHCHAVLGQVVAGALYVGAETVPLCQTAQVTCPECGALRRWIEFSSHLLLCRSLLAGRHSAPTLLGSVDAPDVIDGEEPTVAQLLPDGVVLALSALCGLAYAIRGASGKLGAFNGCIEFW